MLSKTGSKIDELWKRTVRESASKRVNGIAATFATSLYLLFFCVCINTIYVNPLYYAYKPNTLSVGWEKLGIHRWRWWAFSAYYVYGDKSWTHTHLHSTVCEVWMSHFDWRPTKQDYIFKIATTTITVTPSQL